MSTVPVPGGETASILVADMTVKVVAGVEPNVTALASLKEVPVIVVGVPPPVGPELGATCVIFGACW